MKQRNFAVRSRRIMFAVRGNINKAKKTDLTTISVNNSKQHLKTANKKHVTNLI